MLFQQIDHNKRMTWVVVVLILLLVLGAAWWLAYWFDSTTPALWFGGLGLIYLVWNYFYATTYLMSELKAKQLTPETEPKIMEIVSELCIAAGIPEPKVYIVPDPEPNAFAMGRDPKHARLALTQGLVELLDENELRGVIGHELAHIQNYDVRLTTLASGCVTVIVGTGVALLVVAYGLLKTGSGLIGFILTLFGLSLGIVGGGIWLAGMIVGKIFLLMLSRQREYLADAGSVALTREPSGLISALQKLEKIEAGTYQTDYHYANLAFAPHLSGNSWRDWLCDHPSLAKRIDRLEHAASIPDTHKFLNKDNDNHE